MIPFSKPPLTKNKETYIRQSMKKNKIYGDGKFIQEYHVRFEKTLACSKAFLITSCMHAFEMAAILIDIQSDDEVIISSYTFLSTDNTFTLIGAKVAFIDILPDTININETLIKDAAQGIMAKYKEKSIGHIGTFSFHETKNYTSGGDSCIF